MRPNDHLLLLSQLGWRNIVAGRDKLFVAFTPSMLLPTLNCVVVELAQCDRLVLGLKFGTSLAMLRARLGSLLIAARI